MNDVMKIVKSLEVASLLIKGFSETIKNEAKEQKGRFLSMLLGALGSGLLENLLTVRSGEDAIRAGRELPTHPFTNFEIQKYYQNDPKFSGVYSRNNLPKINYAAYIMNLDHFNSIGTHLMALVMVIT